MKTKSLLQLCLYICIINFSCSKSGDSANSSSTNNSLPKSAFTYSGDLVAPTAGVYFVNTSKNADTYKWDFGNGETATTKDASTRYLKNGVYTVTLTVNALTIAGVASVENTSKQTITVSLPSKPLADFELLGLRLTGKGLICSNTIQPLPKDSYGKNSWDFGDNTGTIVAGNPAHCYRLPGTYTVKLTVTQSLTNLVATATKVITIYEIGQKLFGGTIFYADSVGNCLVAADNDLATNFTWGCMDKITNITKTSPMAGKDNSSKIITQCGNSTAAYTCSQLISNGYSDWYLPSVDELSLMWDAKNFIGSFDHNGYRYLSSTEAAFNSARVVDFALSNRTTGIQAILKSDNFFKIRPIRTQLN